MVGEAGLRRHKRHISRFPASGKTRSFCCGSFPQRTRFAGLRRGPGMIGHVRANTPEHKKQQTHFRVSVAILVREAGLEPARPQ